MNMPVEIKQQVYNLSGDLTVYQGPHVLTWIQWPALGVGLLHSVMPKGKE